MSRQLSIICAIFSVLLAASCSRFSGTTIATVDGSRITDLNLKAEMQMERRKFDPAILTQKANFEEFRKQALEKLIQEEILLSEAKRLGIKATSEEIKEIEKTGSGALVAREGDKALSEHGVDPKAWFEAQKRRLVIGKLIDQEVVEKIPVPQEKIAAYYKQHIQEFNQPTQFRARQILVDTRERAEEIMAKLKAGESFEELARRHSQSPDGKRGGDLGYFDSRTYPPIFSEICQQLKIGETSGIVNTDYGFQMFQLIDRRPARQISLEEATPNISMVLKEEKGEAEIEKWAKGLKEKTKVTIDERTLKGVTLDETT